MPTNLKHVCGDRYRVVDDGTDDADRAERVWCQEIRGRHGVIYPYSRSGALAVRVESARVVKNVRKLGLKVVQAGDQEVVFVFDLKLLDEIASLVLAKKRRHLSPEARDKATERLRALADARKKPGSLHSEGVSHA